MEPHVADAIGYLGAMLVFFAFWTKDIVPLRIIALASNVAFLIYGVLTGATPILLLHAALLPLNSLRLAESIRAPEAPPASNGGSSQTSRSSAPAR